MCARRQAAQYQATTSAPWRCVRQRSRVFRHHPRTIGARRGAEIDRPSDFYMDAARFGRCLRRDGIEVRLQSYIRPTSAELGSA
jgi:hypothetical protein